MQCLSRLQRFQELESKDFVEGDVDRMPENQMHGHTDGAMQGLTANMQEREIERDGVDSKTGHQNLDL